MKKVLSVAVVFILALSLFACGTSTPNAEPSADTAPPSPSSVADDSTSPSGGEPAPSSEIQYGGILKVVNSAEGSAPLGIPWAQATLEQLLLAPFFEELIKTTTKGEMLPCLAESWNLDMDNNEIVVNIRPNVTFFDGSALTADVAGWNVMKQVEAHLVQHITSYETRGDLVLVLKYDTWSNDVLSSLGACGLCSKESFEKNGEEWAAENPIGTGPFMLKEYIHGQHLLCEKNPNYWQEGKPYLDGVQYIFMRDAMTQNMAIQAAGDDSIDVLNINSAEQVSMLKATGLFNITILHTGPVSLTPSSMDTESPLSNLKVRQAISYAVDREAIVAARGFGICTPGTQLVSSESMAHLPDEYDLTYDPDKARELLVEAGYPDGFHTTLYTQPGVADKEVTVAVQQMLEAVGITTDLEFPDAGGYSSLRAGGWDGITVNGLRQFAIPYKTFYLYFDPAQTFMVSAARPDGWTEVMEAALKTEEPEAGPLQDCHKLLLENLTTIPLYNMSDNWIIKQSVHDTYYGYIEHASLSDAWMG